LPIREKEAAKKKPGACPGFLVVHLLQKRRLKQNFKRYQISPLPPHDPRTPRYKNFKLSGLAFRCVQADFRLSYNYAVALDRAGV
jgi:hypothetical protein